MDGSTRLAVEAAAGDARALSALVEATYDQVWRLCAALVDADSADDLAQDSFARAVRALPSFRAEANARTWLLAIARNACMDELRNRSRRRRTADAYSIAARPEPTVSGIGDGVVVRDLLRRLAPERRDAFVLTQLLCLPYQEAAAICGCPPGTIRSRVARARADLLTLIDAAGGPAGHTGGAYSA